MCKLHSERIVRRPLPHENTVSFRDRPVDGGLAYPVSFRDRLVDGGLA
jgi:hypothetical protein